MRHKGSHRLTRVDIGRIASYPVYKCTLPGCSHTIIPELLLGRETLCNECDLPIIIATTADLLVKPKCLSCRERTEVDMKQVEEVIEKVRE